MGSLRKAWDCIEKVYENLPEDYTLIVCADHGGHGRGHGTDMPEDMTIPVVFYGKAFEAGKVLDGVSIKDISVTIAKLLDVTPPREWEGRAWC